MANNCSISVKESSFYILCLPGREFTIFTSHLSEVVYFINMYNLPVVYRESSGGIVFSKSKVLLIEITYPYHEYIFPKGTIEAGETKQETAVREVFEETGYLTDILAPLGDLKYDFTDDRVRVVKTVHYYLMAPKDPKEAPQPNLQEDEYIHAKWATISEAIDILTHENLKDLLNEAAKLHRCYSNNRASFLSNGSSERK